jgi:hypothetical protein
MGSSRILNLSFADGRECRRQWPRQLIALSARLSTVGRDYAVRIRDLSSGGARIEGAEFPAVGADVMLKRGEAAVFGKVAWVSGNQAGVAFEEALDEAARDAVTSAPDMAIPMQDGRRPGFGRKPVRQPRWSNGTGWIDG